jgi:hypothetical protein
VLALIEMYVKGVSTRKVTDIVEQFCGLSVSASQVSVLVKRLDGEPTAWRSRSLAELTALARSKGPAPPSPGPFPCRPAGCRDHTPQPHPGPSFHPRPDPYLSMYFAMVCNCMFVVPS